MHAVSRFSADLASVAGARSWLATQLRPLAPSALVNDAQLCLSELAANAVNHAGSDFEVEVRRFDDRLRITVSDESDERPVLRSVDPSSQRGRGLLIVDAVSQRWGVTTHEPTGKSVWCELPLDGSA